MPETQVPDVVPWPPHWPQIATEPLLDPPAGAVVLLGREEDTGALVGVAEGDPEAEPEPEPLSALLPSVDENVSQAFFGQFGHECLHEPETVTLALPVPPKASVAKTW